MTRQPALGQKGTGAAALKKLKPTGFYVTIAGFADVPADPRASSFINSDTNLNSSAILDELARDEEAMAYLGRVIAPLAVGYASYALLYDEHKSWYSWLLRAVVGPTPARRYLPPCCLQHVPSAHARRLLPAACVKHMRGAMPC